MANRKNSGSKQVTEVRESVHDRLESGYYKGTLPYPKREDFHIEEQVVTKKLGTQTLKGFDQEGYNAAMKAYREEQCNLNEEFKADALREVGLTGHPKADKCFSLAKEHGHSDGYGNVLAYLIDFADLVKE